MRGPFIGSEAVARGAISRGALRWNYSAIHPDIYLRKDAWRDLYARTVAAWLWTGRTGIVTGLAAAALHGVSWIDDTVPVELIAKHGRRRPGVAIREERIGEDEVVRVGNLPVASPARTALDLGRHLERDSAVAHIDALAAVTGLTRDEIRFLEDRYHGARGIRAARIASGLMDGGARSQQQSQLRLRLIDAGLPRPRTSIVVGDDLWEAVIAMGWDGPKVGVDCFYAEDTDRYRAVQRIATDELFQRLGWLHFRIPPDHTAISAIRRVRAALQQRRMCTRSMTEKRETFS
ncbi:hypothetical protein [Mycolicibacterium tusciae]|uniref:hypothetical protein n=1 Tax=Mycolicibacterium tusciae TaxID=75922 RepID=UPI00024A2A6D|nr:hypothetical protein [Mycolicibacterium tusciae]